MYIITIIYNLTFCRFFMVTKKIKLIKTDLFSTTKNYEISRERIDPARDDTFDLYKDRISGLYRVEFEKRKVSSAAEVRIYKHEVIATNLCTYDQDWGYVKIGEYCRDYRGFISCKTKVEPGILKLILDSKLPLSVKKILKEKKD